RASNSPEADSIRLNTRLTISPGLPQNFAAGQFCFARPLQTDILSFLTCQDAYTYLCSPSDADRTLMAGQTGSNEYPVIAVGRGSWAESYAFPRLRPAKHPATQSALGADRRWRGRGDRGCRRLDGYLQRF